MRDLLGDDFSEASNRRVQIQLGSCHQGEQQFEAFSTGLPGVAVTPSNSGVAVTIAKLCNALVTNQPPN